MDFLACAKRSVGRRHFSQSHSDGGGAVIRPLGQQQQDKLVGQAATYQPRSDVVSKEIVGVIRQVLVAGVRAHGIGGVVRGVASMRDVTTVGGVLARFLPRTVANGHELSDIGEILSRANILWWSASGDCCGGGVDSRDKAALMWARSWGGQDPVVTWLDDKMHPDPPRPHQSKRAVGGYTASELAEIFLWCEQQHTQRRRDVCAAVVGLSFGAGISAAELRMVTSDDIAVDGSTAAVGGKILPVRPEVRSALAALRDRNVLLKAVKNPLSLVPHPVSFRVQTRRLQETWGVAELAEGRSLQSVMQRIPRSTALRAVEAAPDFGPWPAGVGLNAGAVRAAPLGDLVMGAETSFSPSLQVIQGGRL